MNLIVGAEFEKVGQKNNLGAVRAIVRVVAIMIKVAVVSEIDPICPIGVHCPKVKGRGPSRPVGGEHNLGAIGAVGRVVIIN